MNRIMHMTGEFTSTETTNMHVYTTALEQMVGLEGSVHNDGLQ